MGGCMDTRTLARSATRDEVSFFAEHGWVRLPGLVGPGLVDILRLRAQARLTASGDVDAPTLTDQVFGQDRDVAEVDDEFRRLAHHPAMAANAVALLGTAERLRVQITNVLVKEPRGRGRHSAAMVFHRDFPWMPMDRSSMLTVWVALAPGAPDMGPVRFYDRSHRHGLLGRSFVRPGDYTPSHHPWLGSLPIVGGVRDGAG
jgi:hypothetical protein